MKYSLHAERLTLSATDRQQLDAKLARLRKHLNPPFMIDVVFRHDPHHLKGAVITCAINIKQGKKVFHTERAGQSALTALDQSLAALRRELKKEHDKHKRHGGGVQQ
jgi:ribosomal subunit interface protein